MQSLGLDVNIFSEENKIIAIKESVEEENDVPMIDKAMLADLLNLQEDTDELRNSGFSEGVLDEDGNIIEEEMLGIFEDLDLSNPDDDLLEGTDDLN